MQRVEIYFLMVLGMGVVAKASEVAPGFRQPPNAERMPNGSVRISFEIDRPTDVAVYVESGKGTVVRHLAAGVLGPNAPQPFQPNSLAQSLIWDGKADYNKPAGNGSFRIRVGLGLQAHYGGVMHEDRQDIGARALAVGPDGTLFVRAATGQNWPTGTGEIISAYNRDGSYQRTVAPYSSDLSKAQLGDLQTVEFDGKPAPVVRELIRRDFYGNGSWTYTRTGMAMTPQGVLLLPLADGPRLAALDTRGSVPWKSYAGPSLFEHYLRPTPDQRVYVASSSDGRHAFVSGLGHAPGPPQSYKPKFAVFRVPLPGRANAEAFFGDPEKKGAGKELLGGEARGLAVDGKGHLLIADPGNKRVVIVDEESGAFSGEMPVAGVHDIHADRVTGAIYVLQETENGGMTLARYDALSAATPSATLPLGPWGAKRARPIMALDTTAKPPIAWIAAGYWKDSHLMRIEDAGGSFSKPKRVNRQTIGSGGFTDLSVDRISNEVYFKAGGYWRLDEKTGKVSPYEFTISGGQNRQVVAGYDGSVYVHHANKSGIFRFDREGKPMPWPDPSQEYIPVAPDMYVITSHQLGVRSDGHIFVFANPGKSLRGSRYLQHYGPDGKKLDDGPVWWVSEAAVGPKFDAQGNIYIAEQIKPSGRPAPPPYDKMPEVARLYGSIVKFSPKGGSFRFSDIFAPHKDGPNATLPKDMKTVNAEYTPRGSTKLVGCEVTGAEWMHLGVSHIEHAGCVCENIRFDVDGFGRVFYPDAFRFRVGVIDTNGNPITHFGGYGNADSRGPESAGVALAKPEIAFAWLVGVAVTDRHAYMGDTVNRRLLRAELTYALEKDCTIP